MGQNKIALDRCKIDAEVALKLCETGEYKQAGKLAQGILDKFPKNDTAEFVIALYEEATGDIARSIRYCRRAIKHAPDLLNYQWKLALLLLADRQLEETEQILSTLLRHAPEDLGTIRSLALVNELKGDATAAYHHLIKIKRLKALSDTEKYRLADNLRKVDRLPSYPELEQDISDIVDYDNIDLNHCSIFSYYYLSKKYQLNNDDSIIDLAELATDQLLLKSLKKLLIITPEMETLITQLRHNILNEVATQQTIDGSMLPLIEAISLQNSLNEYVYLISDDEKHIIDLFSALLGSQSKNSTWAPKQSELTLLCLSMYGRLHEHTERDRLLQFPIEAWPSSLTSIAETTLFEPAQEVALMPEIASLSSIDDETSQLVRTQYEANPYPRWISPPFRTYRCFADYMTILSPNCSPPKRLKQPEIDVLVAGCGTGQEPINYALSFKSATMVAVDISLRSLAYAQRKANDFNVNNIDFFHGDILNMAQLKQRFNLILCSGVLHHMAEPLTGWKILRDLLADDGVLKISLYSAIARREITTHRKAIEALGHKPDTDQIRRYRHALMGANRDSGIKGFRDFWTLNECRDLLFHFQEHQFTWLTIEASLAQLDMELIGVSPPLEVFQLYQAAFPNDIPCCNLQNWHQLECQNPHLFRSMYTFLCQKK